MSDPKPSETPSPPPEGTLPTQPPSSKLTQEQKAAVEKWFTTKIAPHNPRCSLCGAQNWALLDDFVTPTNFMPSGGIMLGGTSYPHFMLACRNCGHVHFINAIITGVIPRDT